MKTNETRYLACMRGKQTGSTRLFLKEKGGAGERGNFNARFTLIELLVVIAIIAILAG